MPPSQITTAGKMNADERARGWRTIRAVLPYLWSHEAPWVKRRVILAMVMLVIAKIISVSTPFVYRAAVNTLSGDAGA
ncbi:MAG: metal ABC transporter permease, partial [Sphingomonadales bacterium]|nr:metal ABC transporter permease [Sphingomonadales bacterium]